MKNKKREREREEEGGRKEDRKRVVLMNFLREIRSR